MLIHQNHCQSCGSPALPPAAFCSSCGAPLSPTWPSQSYGPSSAFPFPPMAGASSQPNYTPIIVEMCLNFIGLYGVGWLLAGYRVRGMVLLLGSLLLWPVVALLSIFTLGLGLICLGPLAIVAIACNSLLLRQTIKSKAC